jgi:NADPH:quinone reductase-like Zn-dependent oxidoreductase
MGFGRRSLRLKLIPQCEDNSRGRHVKSVVRDRYGGPDVLRVAEVETPKPRAGELLVKVHSTTVNRTDCAGLWGRPFLARFVTGFPRPRKVATGTDFAGEVVSVGEGVSDFQAGDRVFGFDDMGIGSHAQFLTYPADKAVSKIPAGISYDVAVASLEGAHYALNFINKVRIEPGNRVLVFGATGAIGSAAVQLLRDKNIHVTAVCGPEQVQRVAELGPDRVIDFVSTDYTQEGLRYDFVFDAVGKSRFRLARRVLNPRGIYISSELGPGWENLPLALITPALRGRKVVFPFPVDIKGTLRLMSTLLMNGKFKPLIDRHYPIDRIAEAFTYVDSGQKIGNVLLSYS